MKECHKNPQTDNKKLAISEEFEHYIWLVEKIKFSRDALLNHPVYNQLGNLISLRIFMEPTYLLFGISWHLLKPFSAK